MSILFKSTRGNNDLVTASEAIVKGIAPDGGLYIPCEIPRIDFGLKDMLNFSYQRLAYEILKLVLSDFTEEELKYCIKNAYDEKFDTDIIAPLKETNGSYFLELFHGRTLAFKDMALSILPYLLKTAAKKNGVDKKIVILTATSGDTGKAALEGFANVEGTEIIVFFPEEGVSAVQKSQMVTQKGANTCVVGIKGNFDDAQTAVKKIFTDKNLAEDLDKKGYIFSSANSINIGRLVPQIVYYFYAYSQMVNKGAIKLGDEINFTVPTGNFGNILAGFYAKEMGLPIKNLICASNNNKVLYDFFKTGSYDINREFIVTVSPSMDILISSNLERFLYHLSESTDKIKELMGNLNNKGKYCFDIVGSNITGEYSSEAETFGAIKDVYSASGYVMDTHTAVAYVAYKKYSNQTNDTTKNVIISTASPYKFAKDVCIAIDSKYNDVETFEALNTLSQLQKDTIPESINNIEKRQILHDTILEKDKIKEFICNYLK